VGIGYEVHVYSQWKDEKTADKDVVPSDALRSPGLFNEVLRRNPTLPQYHPKYLMELLDFGKLRRVRAILNHLVSAQWNDSFYKTLIQGVSQKEKVLSVKRKLGKFF
jgi:hypothetical protein